MVTEVFLRKFRPVLEAWGSAKFPPAILERVERKTRDFTDAEMQDLCDRVLDNCDYVPTASKILEHAASVRSRNAKNKIELPWKPKCDFCFDLGIIQAKIESEKLTTLMRCSCEDGKNHEIEIPQWLQGLNKKITRLRCDTDWFKPTNLKITNGLLSYDSMDEKVETWMFRKKSAVDYWKQN